MFTNDTHGGDSSGSQILHPGSRKLFVTWERLRAERRFPSRADFELAAMKDIISHLVVIERDHIRNTLRYRLAGTGPCQLFGRNLTATDALAGWDPFERGVIRKHFDLTLTQHQPTLMRLRYTTDKNQVVAAEFLGLPVETDTKCHFQILGGIFPFRPAAQLGHQKIILQEMLSIRTVWTEHADQSSRHQRKFTVIEGGLNPHQSAAQPSQN